MKYSLEKNIKEPQYLQLYKLVREDIVKGIYPYGSKLPSKRTMSGELSVSTVTVEHAYALLIEEGYIEAAERSGYKVVFRVDDGFLPSGYAVKKTPKTTVSDINDEVRFPFSVLSKTMRAVISASGDSILDRSPNEGTYELRDAISQYLARSRGIETDVNQIIIGSGAEYLYSLIVELLGREKNYAIENPSYNKIEQVYLAADVKLQKLPLGTDGIESDSLWNSTADVLHISPYRSFPSGVSASASKRHEYLRWAQKGRRIIIEDDFETEFSVSKKSEETLFSHTVHNNVIYMNTFSKTISPSFRVAYMILPENLTEEFRKKLGFYSCTVPTYIQLVLAELINNGDFERHINRVRRNKRLNK